jgi:uncharacterized membrane protein
MNKISVTYNQLQFTTRHIHYNIVHFTLLLIKVGSQHISLLVEVFFLTRWSLYFKISRIETS